MEQSKRASLSVARSILNHKLIGKKLESYLKVCIIARYWPNYLEPASVKMEILFLSLWLLLGETFFSAVLSANRVRIRSLVTKMTRILRNPW